MIKKVFGIAVVVFLLFFFIGCAGLEEKKEPRSMIDIPLSKVYQKKARQYELNRELQLALYHWKIAAHFNPEDPEIPKRFALVNLIIEGQAKKFFKKGESFFKQKRFKEARRAFLITLRYKPRHKEANDYLKNRFHPPHITAYKVKKGDGLTNIARKVYKDPAKSFLIAYFNDLEPDAKLQTGALLNLPNLKEKAQPKVKKEAVPPPQPPEKIDVTTDEPETPPPFDIETALIKARNYEKNKQYKKVLPITVMILKFDTENVEAIDLKNKSFLELGKSLTRQNKYFSALEMLDEVEPGFENLDDASRDLRARMDKDAQKHYREGFKLYLDEKYEKAIEQWQTTLKLNPEHPEAEKLISESKSLIEKIKGLE